MNKTGNMVICYTISVWLRWKTVRIPHTRKVLNINMYWVLIQGWFQHSSQMVLGIPLIQSHLNYLLWGEHFTVINWQTCGFLKVWMHANSHGNPVSMLYMKAYNILSPTLHTAAQWSLPLSIYSSRITADHLPVHSNACKFQYLSKYQVVGGNHIQTPLSWNISWSADTDTACIDE